MTTYVLAFLLGAIVGIGLLLWHQKSVQQAVAREHKTACRDVSDLRRENQKLREEVQAYEMSDAARSARAQGKVVGMREARNRDQAQRFVDDLTDYGQRNVTIGGGQK